MTIRAIRARQHAANRLHMCRWCGTPLAVSTWASSGVACPSCGVRFPARRSATGEVPVIQRPSEIVRPAVPPAPAAADGLAAAAHVPVGPGLPVIEDRWAHPTSGRLATVSVGHRQSRPAARLPLARVAALGASSVRSPIDGVARALSRVEDAASEASHSVAGQLVAQATGWTARRQILLAAIAVSAIVSMFIVIWLS